MLTVLLESSPAAGGFLNSSNLLTYGSIIVIVVLFYFLMIRPQKKKEKQTQEMRNSLDVGDGVTTIGGIVGLVVSVKEDTVLIETGADRTKMRIKKWAIQDVEKLNFDQ